MSNVSKHEAVKQYFAGTVEELVGGILGFNYSPEDESVFAILPQYSDRNIRTFR